MSTYGKQHFSPEYLRSLMYYEDGKLFWRADAGYNRPPNGPVMRRLNGGGYHQIRVRGRVMMAHRVIWAIVHGSWPSKVIDHINRDKQDNRIENLRDVDHSTNNRNRDAYDYDLAGDVFPANGRWAARIRPSGIDIYLGSYATREEADAANEAGTRLLRRLRQPAAIVTGEPAAAALLTPVEYVGQQRSGESTIPIFRACAPVARRGTALPLNTPSPFTPALVT